MSKPYKIFGHQSRGIDTFQGRNAQLPMSIQKKPQSLNDIPNSQRYQISPFSGYNTPSYQHENNLAFSQVSDPSLNQELMKKMIREQLDKQNNTARTRNQINVIRTQIRSLKQFVQEIGDKSEKNLGEFEEIRGQLYEVMTKIIDDYKVQSAKNLRQVVKKINQNVRRQCVGSLRAEYVPIAFVQDAQKQFSELEDRIILLESKGGLNRSRVQQDPVVLAETVDLRLKKIQREIESLKKQTLQTTTIVKQLEPIQQSYENIKKKQQELDDYNLNNENITKKIKQDNQALSEEIKKISNNLEELKKENCRLGDRVKEMDQNYNDIHGTFQEINKKMSEGGNSSLDVKDFLINSKNLAYSGLFEHQKSTQSKQQVRVAANIQAQHQDTNNKHKDIFESPKKSPQKFIIPTSPQQQPVINYQQISNSNKLQIPSSQIKQVKRHQSSPTNSNSDKLQPSSETHKTHKTHEQQQNAQKIQYRIDAQNHLLDENNNYILDQDGRIVTLTGQQVQLLRKSTLVRLHE